MLANRLSEDPAVNVALIEAGDSATTRELHVPAAYGRLIQSSYDWNLWSEPEPGLGGRRLPLPRGRTLGGSSAVNAMIYIRGHRSDYDAYAARGATGWSYDEVLPYFRRSEDNERGADAYHGTGGPLSVSDPRSRHPLADAFLDACEQAGHPLNPDFNAAVQDGAGRYQLTQRQGRRCSTATAFLLPAVSRPNLTVMTGATVQRILIEHGRATGVLARRDGREFTVAAGQEVVVCAGSYHSPQLLMLSGIGPAAELAAHGIRIQQDLPVGEGLQDHLAVPLVWLTDEPTLHARSTPHNLDLAWHEGRGPMTSNGSEAGAFLRTRDGLPAPDVQLGFAHAIWHEEGLGDTRHNGYTILVSFLHPAGRGRVALRSAAPDHTPRILGNFLTDQADAHSVADGLRLALDMAGQPALRARGGRPFLLPAEDDDRALVEFARRTGSTTYHPTSTCAIGRVVDERLRVLGIEGLRVADASVLPAVPRGNTNAAAIMVAEKASDLIRRRDPLAGATATLPQRSAGYERTRTRDQNRTRNRDQNRTRNRTQARDRLHELGANAAPVDPADLDTLWTRLDTVRPDQILGTWRGTALNTGHPTADRLRALRWYGKAFHSPDEVEPMICRDENGNLYADTQAAGGGGRLLSLPFRGEITTALLYDTKPVVDYFKQADEDTLMGIMTGSDRPSEAGHPFYFVLLRP
ncbi:GMC family oxidoreductase N-terminal domain-containing protein [Streptomyces sp. TRM64462]|uniref:GMC family oxidoreductase N-terminal domain-containing protein n=1 Tax=Streptomyces sp. TRM64462 TaxID=2741726 RepID=UPI0028151026|nr:GMC family oxidoreductase N-terminal domain-containing protein [Streptomyces sp. TRM64462]